MGGEFVRVGLEVEFRFFVFLCLVFRVGLVVFKERVLGRGVEVDFV